jgi:uncharacterized protein (DUF2225 family)
MQKDIKCPQCGTLFGKEVSIKGEPGRILTIKNRDLYRSFKDGTVWGPCRGCAVTVKWPEE